MEQTFYVGVRLPKKTYDALLARKNSSEVQVSLAALIRHLLGESLGVNGKKRRR
jgi:hypothetical protein